MNFQRPEGRTRHCAERVRCQRRRCTASPRPPLHERRPPSTVLPPIEIHRCARVGLGLAGMLTAPHATPYAPSPHTKMSRLTRQGYHLIEWSQSGMTYRAVSELNEREVLEFVRLIQGQA